MSLNCASCSLLIKDENVKCTACLKVFHMKCANITANELRFLLESKSDYKRELCIRGGRKLRSGSESEATLAATHGDFSLSQSRLTTSDLPSSQLDLIVSQLADIKNMQQCIVSDVSAIKESQEQLRTEMNERCLAIDRAISDCNAVISGHTDILNTHEIRIDGLETKVRDIQEGVSNVQETLIKFQRVKDDISSADSIVSEITEREAKKRNLMVFNMPESRDATADGRRQDDEHFIRQLFASIGLDQQVLQAPMKIDRLGRKLEGKIRPVKIVFTSGSLVDTITRHAARLRDLQQYKGIILSRDRTPAQQAQYRSLRQQLHDRTAAGERDLKLVHVNGIPKIHRRKN